MRVDTNLIPAVRTGLESMSSMLDGVSFRLPFPGREAHERDRSEIVRSIAEYLLPRLRDPDAPVVASIVGATGVGKSTVVNSLAQDRISATGVLRPTTRSPVLWAHRDHAGRYWSEFVARVRERVGPALEVVIGDDLLTANLTLIDTPPVDQESEGGVLAAREVLSLSDLCVFVTSASRYADAAGWEFLLDAKRRGVPILFVLNRLPDDAERQDHLLSDYANRLESRDLLLDPDPSLIFGIEEGPIEKWHGGLSPAAVGLLRKELSELSDPEFRHALIDQTTYSAVRSVADRARSLSGALREEDAASRRLESAVEAAYAAQSAQLTTDLRRGELAWLADHDFWPKAAVDLTGIVTRRAGVAAQQAATDWAAEPTGSRFLEEGGQGLWRHGHDTTYETQRLLDEWAVEAQDVAVRHAKRGRLRSRARERVVERSWAAVMRGKPITDRYVVRKFGNGAAAFGDELGTRLTQVLDKALRVDAARFIDFLGDATALHGLDVRIEEQADRILELVDREEYEGVDGSESAVGDDGAPDVDAPTGQPADA